jgi:hypothetical protein
MSLQNRNTDPVRKTITKRAAAWFASVAFVAGAVVAPSAWNHMQTERRDTSLGDQLSKPTFEDTSKLADWIKDGIVVGGRIPAGDISASQVAAQVAHPAEAAIVSDIIDKQESYVGGVRPGEPFYVPAIDVSAEAVSKTNNQ